MDVEEAIHRLRVVRRFGPKPVSQADLEAILEAGRRTGSSKNLQRWYFVVVRDRGRLAELAAVGQFAGHLAGGNVAIALITPDPYAAERHRVCAGDGLRPAAVPTNPRLPRGPALRVHTQLRSPGITRRTDATVAARRQTDTWRGGLLRALGRNEGRGNPDGRTVTYSSQDAAKPVAR